MAPLFDEPDPFALLAGLQRGLKARAAEDRVHALMSPEVYRLFVVDRGWTPEQYRTWLATTLAQQLL